MLSDQLLATAGLRYDHYDESFGGTINPRLGLIWSPTAKTTLKALYGQAYRAPNVYEQFYYRTQDTRPPLEPERMRTYELDCETYPGRRYRLSVSGYRYEVQELISQAATPEGRLYFDNLDGASAQGVEVEVEGAYESGLLARASYAFQRSEVDDTGDELTSSPRHLAKLNLSVPLAPDRWFASLELQFHGSSRTLAGRRADQFLLANLTLYGRRLRQGLEVSASVYNLFDETYGYPGAEDHLQDVIAQDGRTFRLKLTAKLGTAGGSQP
jgi:iron complex outermembrane receptor protein